MQIILLTACILLVSSCGGGAGSRSAPPMPSGEAQVVTVDELQNTTDTSNFKGKLVEIEGVITRKYIKPNQKPCFALNDMVLCAFGRDQSTYVGGFAIGQKVRVRGLCNFVSSPEALKLYLYPTEVLRGEKN